MQNLFNSVKGKALGVAEYLSPVLKESKFRETGVLTPEEFVLAGDHLVHQCPLWRWEAADDGYERPYLPRDKQYLINKNVPCYKRVKQSTDSAMSSDETMVAGVSEDDGDQWVAPEVSEETGVMDGAAADMSSVLKEIEQQQESTPTVESDDEEAIDMEAFMASGHVDDEYDPSEYVAQRTPATNDVIACEDSDILKTRTYDLHITYDKYYQTPKLWLTGYDEERVPLSVEQMYEDFSQEHANKTVTVETHPHLACAPSVACVHPCRHAETMKRMCDVMEDGGKHMEVYMYLFVFLKFMQAIIPTVEYDHTKSISL